MRWQHPRACLALAAGLGRHTRVEEKGALSWGVHTPELQSDKAEFWGCVLCENEGGVGPENPAVC